MKISKSLYIYILQMLLILFQLIQICSILSLNPSTLIIIGVMIYASVYSYIKYTYYFGKKKILFWLYFITIIGLFAYFNYEIINPLIELILTYQNNTNPLTLDMFWSKMTNPEYYNFYFYLFVYALVRILFITMYQFNAFKYQILLTSGILIWALVSGRTNNVALSGMLLLVFLIFYLMEVQKRLEVFNIKVFIPISCVVVIACVVSFIFTQLFMSPPIDVLGNVVKQSIKGINYITEQVGQEAFLDEDILDVGITSLKPLEVNPDKKQEDFLKNEDTDKKDESDKTDTSDKKDESNKNEGSDKKDESNEKGENDKSQNQNVGEPSVKPDCGCNGGPSVKPNNDQALNDNSSKKNNEHTHAGLGDGSLTNATQVEEEPYTVLIVKGNTNISRLKVYSGGYYDYDKSKFLLSSKNGVSQAISKINSMLPANYSFFNLFMSQDNNMKYYVNVENVAASKVVYVPYGRLYFEQNAYLFEDNYYSMYQSSDYQNYTVYFDQSSEFSESFPFPEALNEYQKAVYKEYLQVPKEMKKTLQKFLLDNGINYKSNDKGKIIKQIKNLLQTKYKYTLEPGKLPEDAEVITYFLTENKKGYCIHFASAATMLYRVSGIPARYVSGYVVPTMKDGIAEVSSDNAHAWTEVFQIDQGWIPIEVTASGGGTGNGAMDTSAEMQNMTDKKEDIEDLYDVPEDEEIQEAIEDQTEVKDEEQSSNNEDKKEDEDTKEENKNEDVDNKEDKDESKDEEVEEEKESSKFILTFIKAYLIEIILILSTFILGLIIFVNHKHKELKKSKMSLIDKIYECYHLLEKYDFVTDEIHSLMLRIQFSNRPIEDCDLNVLLNRKEELIKHLMQTKKFHQKVMIYLFDKLPVFRKQS